MVQHHTFVSHKSFFAQKNSCCLHCATDSCHKMFCFLWISFQSQHYTFCINKYRIVFQSSAVKNLLLFLFVFLLLLSINLPSNILSILLVNGDYRPNHVNVNCYSYFVQHLSGCFSHFHKLVDCFRMYRLYSTKVH